MRSMSFPLSISDLWKVFEYANSQRTKNKEAVFAWLDAVYKDLEDLSNVWFRICETLETANEEKELEKAYRILIRRDRPSQAAFSGRLSRFYESASAVLGSRKMAGFHEDFILDLGAVLKSRMRAREMLDKKPPLISVANESTSETLLRMREYAEALQRDVITLQALITTFKAQS